MMLRIAVAKVLFNLHPGMLINKEITECNKLIDNYNKIQEVLNDGSR